MSSPNIPNVHEYQFHVYTPDYQQPAAISKLHSGLIGCRQRRRLSQLALPWSLLQWEPFNQPLIHTRNSLAHMLEHRACVHLRAHRATQTRMRVGSARPMLVAITATSLQSWQSTSTGLEATPSLHLPCPLTSLTIHLHHHSHPPPPFTSATTVHLHHHSPPPGCYSRNDKRSSFSNYGMKCTDVFAPGSDIWSAWCPAKLT